MDTDTFVAQGADDPLSAAVADRDKDRLKMVEAAISGGNVRLAFQPVFAIDRSERPAFFEGLIRILDATGRVIPARDFIGAVEASDLGRRIDCLALEMGLAALREVPNLRLSVNLSARSIGYAPWLRTLEEGLQGAPDTAARLILEITESSAILMPDVVKAFMTDLQDQGIAFALDDFGAGYSSFRYLRDLYFDILKIDGRFINGVHASPDDQALVKALIGIGRHFDMVTVAEGVESPRDAEYLAQIGIDCLQGYHLGVPTLTPDWNMRRPDMAGPAQRAG